MVIANVGTPQNARSAIVSPNAGPHTGFLRLAFSDPEERKLSQAEIAARAREILTRDFPGVEVLQYPGGLVASVFANGYTAPLVRRGARRQPRRARRAGEGRRRGRPHASPASATCASSLQIDYPEIRVETEREKAGLVGVTLARRGADDARRDARQHQHAERVDRLGERPVVLRRHVLRRPARRRHPGARAAPRARQRRRARPSRSAPTPRSAAASAPSPSSATSSSAPPTCSCRPRGATSARAAADLEQRARRRTRARATSSSTSSGRSS